MAAISPCYRLVRSLAVFASLLAPAAAQGAPTQESSKAAGPDVIRLQNGNVLEGSVLAEDDDSITLRLGAGQEVQIPKAIVAKYARRSASTEAADASARAFWSPRHQSFQLRDAEGHIIGKLHYFVRPHGKGGVQLEQQWSFFADGHKSFVSRIEVLDAQRRPQSFVYRESKQHLASAEHTAQERLVQGEVREAKLHLREVDRNGRKTRAIPFPDGNSFPLTVAESLRRGELDDTREYSASVYDPLDGVFELRRYRLHASVPVRRKAVSRAARNARLIESSEHGRTRREWVDASGEIQLVEVNGVHLVAEPVAAEAADAIGLASKARLQARVLTFAGHELWLPRATWRFGRQRLGEGRVQILPPVEGVRVEVRSFGNEAAGEAILQNASERALRHFALENERFRETSQELVTIGELPGLRIEGVVRDAEGRESSVTIWLRELGDAWLATSVVGPRKAARQVLAEARELVEGVRAKAPTSVVSAKPAFGR